MVVQGDSGNGMTLQASLDHFPLKHDSGQIIATSHDLTPNGGLVRECSLFQGNLGWWNIIIWPDDYPTLSKMAWTRNPALKRSKKKTIINLSILTGKILVSPFSQFGQFVGYSFCEKKHGASQSQTLNVWYIPTWMVNVYGKLIGKYTIVPWIRIMGWCNYSCLVCDRGFWPF